jgi:hypothetical protein
MEPIVRGGSRPAIQRTLQPTGTLRSGAHRSRDAGTAVVTDQAAFVAHWDDVCYPAFDDLTVAPLAGGWALCYRH